MRLRAFHRDLICGEHYGQRPSQSAATTGPSRACKHALSGKGTDGSTDQHCITVEKSLADREPSTDDPERTLAVWQKGDNNPLLGSGPRHQRRQRKIVWGVSSLTRLRLLTPMQVFVDAANTREYEGCTPTEQNHSIDSLYAA